MVCSSVEEHMVHTHAVPGSNPGTPTKLPALKAGSRRDWYADVVQWQNTPLVWVLSRVRFPPSASKETPRETRRALERSGAGRRTSDHPERSGVAARKGAGYPFFMGR